MSVFKKVNSAQPTANALIVSIHVYLIDVHKMAYSAEKQELNIFGGEGLKSIGRDSIVNKQCFLKSWYIDRSNEKSKFGKI